MRSAPRFSEPLLAWCAPLRPQSLAGGERRGAPPQMSGQTAFSQWPYGFVFPVKILCNMQWKIEVNLIFLNCFLSIHVLTLNHVFELTHVSLRRTPSKLQKWRCPQGRAVSPSPGGRRRGQWPGLSFRGSQGGAHRCLELVLALLKMVLSL